MSKRILIVDDEHVDIALLKAMLVNVADEILGVVDSSTAEEAFKNFAPDLVLLDLHMPHPDGLEVLRRLRSARAGRGFLPVIVLSEERNAARSSALMLGADDFLAKPLDRQEVVLRVRNHLRMRDLVEETQRATGGLPKTAE